MLAILGPAKTIDLSPQTVTGNQTRPDYLERSKLVVEQLRSLSLAELKNMMKLSDNLAIQTFETYARWKPEPEPGMSMQALLAFSGEVFRGLGARSLDEKDLLFAQGHVRILSGLYGVLRPLDLIRSYRLEMGTRIQVGKARDLYVFWKDIIPKRIQSDTREMSDEAGPPVLINLASNEYFRSIGPGSFPMRIVTPVFRESTPTGYRNVTVYAKRARGLMLRFIIENRITDPEHLQGFDAEGYAFNPGLSGSDQLVFSR